MLTEDTQASESITDVDSSKYESGVYTIVLFVGDAIITRKIIKID